MDTFENMNTSIKGLTHKYLEVADKLKNDMVIPA